MTEPDFLDLLRAFAAHPAARGFADDAAVLGDLVLTHDMLVEGVHFVPTDPPGDVAWKLLATNLSDLAAKGATPLGGLLGYPLSDDTWDRAFVAGLGEALAAFDVALLGGDTVRGPRVLGMTAIGRAGAPVPARSGAREGDFLWVTGTIGDAGLGLAIARGDSDGPAALLDRYRRPRPRLAEGRALAPHVHAMMDVSDGLLIDAARMADASGLAVEIDLAAVPLGHATDVLAAATAGDDYELLFAASQAAVAASGVAATRIGRFTIGEGLTLHDGDFAVPLPPTLGWVHR